MTAGAGGVGAVVTLVIALFLRQAGGADGLLALSVVGATVFWSVLLAHRAAERKRKPEEPKLFSRARLVAIAVSLLSAVGGLMGHVAEHASDVGFDSFLRDTPTAQQCISTAFDVARSDGTGSVGPPVRVLVGPTYEQDCSKALHCHYRLLVSQGAVGCSRDS